VGYFHAFISGAYERQRVNVRICGRPKTHTIQIHGANNNFGTFNVCHIVCVWQSITFFLLSRLSMLTCLAFAFSSYHTYRFSDSCFFGVFVVMGIISLAPGHFPRRLPIIQLSRIIEGERVVTLKLCSGGPCIVKNPIDRAGRLWGMDPGPRTPLLLFQIVFSSCIYAII